MNDIEIGMMRALVTLVAERSVSRAAARLGTSQASMSRVLQRWRECLGDPIMVRTGRDMQPTPRAVAVAEELAEVLQRLESVLAGEGGNPSLSRRIFRLAAWDYTQAVILPPLVAAMAERAPAMRLEVQPWQDRFLVRQLERGEIDLLVGLNRELPSGCFRRGLFRDRFVCLIRAGHGRVRTRLSLRTYVELPHVLVAPFGPAKGAVDHALEARGERRFVQCWVPDFHAAPAIVRASDLVATVPERIAREAARAGGIRVVEPPVELPSFEVEVVWHERTQHSIEHRWLRELLLEVAGGV